MHSPDNFEGVLATRRYVAGPVLEPGGIQIVTSHESPSWEDEETWYFDRRGRLLSGRSGCFCLREEIAEVATPIPDAGEAPFSGWLPLDDPIPDPAIVSSLVLLVESRAITSLSPHPGLRVSRQRGGLRLEVRRHPATREFSSLDRRSHIESTDQYPTEDPRIQTMAKTAVGGSASTFQRIARLVEVCRSSLEPEQMDDELSISQILELKRGDCSEHSLLLATLARAAGIPAKQVSGLAYCSDPAPGFYGHAWNEVFADGRWIVVDPAWGEIDPPPLRIPLSNQDLGEFRMSCPRPRLRVIQIDR